ncbi:MAG: 50S ribosomal protein L6, partial [Desulfurococcaceae archaeon]
MPKMLHVVESVEIPPEVAVEVNGLQVKVSGPKGVLIKDFSHA